METSQEHSHNESVDLSELKRLSRPSSPHEPLRRSVGNGQIDTAPPSNGSSVPLDSGHGPTGHGSASVAQADLLQTATEPPTALHGDDVRGRIRNDLHSGKLQTPPSDITVPAQNLVIYQFPPDLLDHDFDSKHKKRFDRSALLPDSNLPLCSQIMAYAQNWGMWVADHPSEKIREKMLDRVFDMATKAWFEALQLGYRPDGASAEAAGTRTSNKKGKPKRAVSPSRVPFLTASHKHGREWAVTAGELEAHGIAETRIRSRAADPGSLDNAGRRLLRRILATYDDQIAMSDWRGVDDRTKMNPLGRDLAVYCVFEVLKCDDSIHLLESYHEKQKTFRQKEATQRRIDEEKERQNLFMALAMELEEDNPRSPSPSISFLSSEPEDSASNAVMTDTAEADQDDQLESLIDAVERILEETDIPFMISTFDLYEISEDDLHTGVSVEDLPSNVERCKHVMREMLLYARQWASSSENGVLEMDLDTNVNVQELELQIQRSKEILAELLPSLFAERDAARSVAIEDNAMADVDMVPVATDATSTADLYGFVHQPPDLRPVVAAKHPLVVLEEAAPETNKSSTEKEKTRENGKLAQIEVSVPAIEVLVEGVEGDGKQRLSTSKENTSANHPARKEASQHNPRVLLRVRPGFDPNDWTSKKVFDRQGFSFRYAPESTLAQRISMDDTLTSFVRGCTQGGNIWRFGKYQSLTHPNNPYMTIIHGVWNLKNGSRQTGLGRFYDENHLDYMGELEATLMSETEDDEPIAPPERPSVANQRKRQAPEDNTSLPQSKKRQVAKPEGKVARRSSRQEAVQSAAAEAEKTRSSDARGKQNTRTGTSKIPTHGGVIKPQYSTAPRLTLTLPKAPKAPRTTAFNDTMPMTRPRRRTARKNYAEATNEADDDEEFQPSD